PADTSHPWATRYNFASRRSFAWVTPAANGRINTTFPFGYNDGPMWAGRGLTLDIQGGFALRRGVLSLTVAPMAFVAPNAGFALMSNGQAGRLAYGDGMQPYAIDRPQRFGSGAYARLDPGQSTLRVDSHKLAVGVTTAHQ